MRVKIIRHGEVDMPWKKKYTSQEYDQAWNVYDTRDILPIKRREELWANAKVYVTSFKRTQQTAEQFLGAVKYTILDRLMDEVPICAFKNTLKAHRKRLYDIIGRIEWYLPWTRQPEHRKATLKRCEELIAFLEEKGEDCILVLHGFYMHALIFYLSRHGYRLDKKKWVVHNLCTVVAEKELSA